MSSHMVLALSRPWDSVQERTLQLLAQDEVMAPLVTVPGAAVLGAGLSLAAFLPGLQVLDLGDSGNAAGMLAAGLIAAPVLD